MSARDVSIRATNSTIEICKFVPFLIANEISQFSSASKIDQTWSW